MAFPDLLLFRFLAFILLSRFYFAFSLLARFLAMSATRIGAECLNRDGLTNITRVLLSTVWRWVNTVFDLF